jgi:hypothetical protein
MEDGGFMAKSTAVKQPQGATESAWFTCGLSAMHARYLTTVRQLLAAYQHAGGFEQRQIFVTMMHAFMQELCGYPPTSYLVTITAYGHAEVGSYPYVIPASYSANSTLFYFTSSENPDDVHDLWVKQAQVYLMDPRKEDAVVESATQVVFSNFFIIDDARKDPKTGAWHLWSAADIESAQVARIDLRSLEYETRLAPTLPHVIHKRLQTLQYQSPPAARAPDAGVSEELVEVMPRTRREGHGA